MTIIERIKEECQKKHISITTLERELHYSNGSLAKAKDIPSSRIFEISQYLGISMEYLMTGKEKNFSIGSANLVKQIRNDTELQNALEQYFTFSAPKKKLVLTVIEQLSDI